MNRRGEISVTFMSGPLDGKTLTFEQPTSGEQRIITIGRRDTCDIHLGFDNQVSRLHARLGCMSNPIADSEASLPALLSPFFWDVTESDLSSSLKNSESFAIARVRMRKTTIGFCNISNLLEVIWESVSVQVGLFTLKHN